MPVNDFEKQVQQKMDELHFAPSDAVWHEVEKQITPRKKRRLLIWLPLLVLLLGGAAWMYNAGKEDKSIDVKASTDTAGDATNTIDKNTKPANSGKPGNLTTKQPVPAKENAAAEHSTNSKQAIAPTTDSSLHNTEAIAKSNSSLNTNKTLNKTISAVQKNKPSQNKHLGHVTKHANKDKSLPDNIVAWKAPGQAGNNKVTTYKDAIDTQTATAATNSTSNQMVTVADTINNKNVSTTDDSIAHISIAADQLTMQKTVIADSSKKLLQPDSTKAAVASKPSDKKKRKVAWGIHVQAGSSNISEGVTSLFKSAPAYDVNSSFFNNQPSSPIGTPGSGTSNGIPTAPPSDVRRGFSYAMGAFISKPVASQLQLKIGLNYHYYSTSIRVGAPVVSSSFSMDQYRTGNTSSYINKYHFIELPVMVQKQFGKSARFSIDGGLSLAWMVASKALLYDVQQNQYVTNKSYINNTQVNLLAAFNYRLFPQSLPVEIGPRFSYGLTNMFKKEIYGSTHLFFTGVQARIYFSKK